MTYDAMPTERLLQLQTRNIAHDMKAPQIGIGRRYGGLPPLEEILRDMADDLIAESPA